MFDPITAAHSFPPLSHPSLWVCAASFKLHYPARIPQCWNLFDYCASREINYTSTLFLISSLLLALQSVMYQSKVRGLVLSSALWVLISRLLVRRSPSVKLASSYLNIWLFFFFFFLFPCELDPKVCCLYNVFTLTGFS